MYIGDLGWRSWRFARGREGLAFVKAEGEVGEILVGGVGVGVEEDSIGGN
jgi:hypothetical protein